VGDAEGAGAAIRAHGWAVVRAVRLGARADLSRRQAVHRALLVPRARGPSRDSNHIRKVQTSCYVVSLHRTCDDCRLQAGTGRIVFRVLLKQGDTLGGHFYWPSGGVGSAPPADGVTGGDLSLAEGAAFAPQAIEWVRASEAEPEHFPKRAPSLCGANLSRLRFSSSLRVTATGAGERGRALV
jgi:hypothetical protein